MKKKMQLSQIIWDNKSMSIFVACVLALVVGYGVYFLANSNSGTNNDNVQEITEVSSDELLQMKSENDELKKQLSEKTTDSVSRDLYELVGGRCSTSECLFNMGNSNNPLGTAVIKGYYSPVERSAWEETKICDSFTITGGSKELIRTMVAMVDGGNTLHSKNTLNQPVINLGFNLVSQVEKQSILTSSVNNQIELIVLSDSPVGAGVPVCYPDVTVLRKK